MLPRPLTIVIAVVVTAAWAVNVVYGFLDPARHDTSLNAIFATVVGAAFALGKPSAAKPSEARKRLGRLIAGEPVEESESYRKMRGE